LNQGVRAEGGVNPGEGLERRMVGTRGLQRRMD
jgi:hypothetical protein